MPGRPERPKRTKRPNQNFPILSDVDSGEELEEEFNPVRQGQLTQAELRREREAREAARRANNKAGQPAYQSAEDKENEAPAQAGDGRGYHGQPRDSHSTMDGHLLWGKRPTPAVVVKRVNRLVDEHGRILPGGRQQVAAQAQPDALGANVSQPPPVASMASPPGRVPGPSPQQASKQEATANTQAGQVVRKVENNAPVATRRSQAATRERQLPKKIHVQPVSHKKAKDPGHKVMGPPVETTAAEDRPSVVGMMDTPKKAVQEGLFKRKHAIEDVIESEGNESPKDAEPPKKRPQTTTRTGTNMLDRIEQATSAAGVLAPISGNSIRRPIVVEDNQQSLVLPFAQINLNDLAEIQREVARARAVRAAIPLGKAFTDQGEKTPLLASFDLHLDWLSNMCALLKKRPDTIKTDKVFSEPTAAAKAMFSGLQNLHKKLTGRGDDNALRLLNKKLKNAAEDVASQVEDEEHREASALSGDSWRSKDSVVNALKFEREALLAIQAGTEMLVDEQSHHGAV